MFCPYRSRTCGAFRVLRLFTGEGLEAPSSVKARLLEEPSEAGEDGGALGGRDDGASAVGLYDISALVRQ